MESKDSVGVSGYVEEEEMSKVEEAMRTLSSPLKEEINRLRQWNQFDVFNVRQLLLHSYVFSTFDLFSYNDLTFVK